MFQIVNGYENIDSNIFFKTNVKLPIRTLHIVFFWDL